MSRYWSRVVRGLKPYVPGEQPKLPDLVKLNSNENPYGPSPLAIEALRGESGDTLRLYPDPNADRLKEAIAASFGAQGVIPRQVFVGNGSDEVLAHVFLALLKHERPVLFPDITYSFYPVYCGLYGIDCTAVPLNEKFEIRTDDYLVPNGGIIFPNPNAPTGRFLPLAEVERLLAGNAGSVVVIDEAYVDFGGGTAIALVARPPNLLIVRTLSKSHSLAGLRIGYAIGQPDLVEALERVKNSFNSYPLGRFSIPRAAPRPPRPDLVEALERVKNSFNSYPLGRLAIAGAAAAIEDRAHFDRNRR